MIQQTLIENKLNTAWLCRWVGKHGRHFEANESIVVEGAYPTACVNEDVRTEMEHDANNQQGISRR